MQWSLFLFILMGSFLTCQQYEYHFIEEEKTWKEAQAYCKEKYTDLATVYDMTDMGKLYKSQQKSTESQEEAWIGLYHMQCWSQSPEEENKSAKAKVICGQPTDERRLLIFNHYNSSYWQDIPFTEKHEFICYDGNATQNKIRLIEENMTWLDAQSYCKKNHTDLVNFLNHLEEKELIREMESSSNSRKYWVGDIWRWSDGRLSSFRHWNDNYPDNKPSKEKCAMTMLNKEGGWKTDNCDEKKSFFCYDDKVILIRENKTWEEALYYCRDNHHDLVSITNYDQQRWVQERAKNADSPYVWLGLRYTCTLDFWFWVSDEVVSYNNWASPAEKDECDMSGAMKREGKKWFIQHDNEKFNFICSLY